jgi:hypothetical protein
MENEKPELKVLNGNQHDPPDIEGVDPALRDFEIRVVVKGSVLVEALADREKWKQLWTQMIPKAFSQNAMELKAMVLNGFKQVTDNTQMEACQRKMIELETNAPRLTIVKALPPGFQNRAMRRKK